MLVILANLPQIFSTTWSTQRIKTLPDDPDAASDPFKVCFHRAERERARLFPLFRAQFLAHGHTTARLALAIAHCSPTRPTCLVSWNLLSWNGRLKKFRINLERGEGAPWNRCSIACTRFIPSYWYYYTFYRHYFSTNFSLNFLLRFSRKKPWHSNLRLVSSSKL